ncbi:astacin, partial [Cooperia oncophora]
SSVNAKANLAAATNATLGGVSSTDGSPPTIEELNRAEGIDEYLFGGDMVLTEEQLVAFEKQAEHPTRTKRQMTSPSRRWTNNRVYYYFDTNITAAHRAFVRKELNYLQTRTCLFFIENATAAARLKVIYGSGCWSYVGRLGGEQELSLGSGCMSVGIVAHEFIHALGSLHMHMRDDRDTYLNVNMTAIPEAPAKTTSRQRNQSTTRHTSTVAIMQYASNIYMTAKQARYQRTMGSRTVSFYDIVMINRFYQCFAACAGKGVTGKCKNKGVPNPKNCNVCICPSWIRWSSL